MTDIRLGVSDGGHALSFEDERQRYHVYGDVTSIRALRELIRVLQSNEHEHHWVDAASRHVIDQTCAEPGCLARRSVG